MKKNGLYYPKAFLWWIAVISLTIGVLVYFLLDKQARLDPSIQSYRILFLMIGIAIAGICLIIGTSDHWFYPHKH